MEKEFEQYINNTRNEFVEAVNQLQWNTGFRAKCENLLLAYDAMKQALRKANVSDSLPKLAGYLFNGRYYKTEEDLRGKTMSEDNQPKPIYFWGW